jgi:geranylgeranyl diphosphate synthase type II
MDPREGDSRGALHLESVWEDLRSRVHAALADRVRHAGPDVPERLREAMQYSLLAGGKRLRPVLVLLAAQAAQPRRSPDELLAASLPAACALEMVHTYSLIHDDLPAMDDDDFRRGKPTNHKVFGDGLAILAGDGLLTWAFEILAAEIQPPAVAAECCRVLASAAGPAGMVGGQAADLQAETDPVGSLHDLERIHVRKTGRLLAAALELGGRVAGADPETLQRLSHYGQDLGLAFQITDDLLDVEGTVQSTGKGVQKDAAQRKLTYPRLLGRESSRARAAQLVARAVHAVQPLGDAARPLVQLAQFVLHRDH